MLKRFFSWLKGGSEGRRGCDLTVILHSIRDHAQLQRCIASFDAVGGRTSLEIMVLYTRGMLVESTQLGSQRSVTLIAGGKESDLPQDINKVAKRAAGASLLFCDADYTVHSGLLEYVLGIMERDPRVALVTPEVVGEEGQEVVCAAINLDRHGVLQRMVPRPETRSERRSAAVFPGCFFSRTQDFFHLGMFSPDYSTFPVCCTHLALGAIASGRQVVCARGFKVFGERSRSIFEEGARPSARDAHLLSMHWGETLHRLARVRVLSFYLPQFHPIPENDQWWGKGFTEWRNVTGAKPNFPGHYQPHLPADLGFYDLRLPEVQEEQARMAQSYGIDGFCYYYYWFDGKKLLERPLQQLHASGKPDFPFCICWANENWTRRWDGREDDILMRQTYAEGFELSLMEDLLPLFQDPRYIRIDGRPLFLVYRIELLPDIKASVSRWRQLCRERGVADLYIACVQSFTLDIDPRELGLDAAVEFPPLLMGELREPPTGITNPQFQGHFFDYQASMRRFLERPESDFVLFRGAMPSWDNTARQQDRGAIFLGASPALFERWVGDILRWTCDRNLGDERLIFVNAWNEWAEGNHLEPDLKFGRAYLEAVRQARKEVWGPEEMFGDGG